MDFVKLICLILTINLIRIMIYNNVVDFTIEIGNNTYVN